MTRRDPGNELFERRKATGLCLLTGVETGERYVRYCKYKDGHADPHVFTGPLITGATPEFKVGDVVEVGPAYQGSGRYGRDGAEGVYTVVGRLARDDYKLCHGTYVETPPDSEWDLICYAARLTLAVQP